MKDLRGQTLSGLKWSGVGHFVRQAVSFSFSIYLARVLSPEEFGLMGMIAVFTGFAALFGELGLGAALVQKKDLQDRHLSSIFWVNVATGAVLTAVLAAAAPLIAAFYQQPALRALATVVSLNFLLGSLAGVQRNMLVRAMDFRRLFHIELAGLLCSCAAALVAARAGLGVWTLVVQSMTAAAVIVVLLWALSSWRPAPRVDREALRELFGYSAHLLGFNLLNYSNRNLDNALIGRFVGASGLGIYARAYDLMLLPISQVTAILTKVMFPAMSAIQDDIPTVKRVYLRATRSIALVTFPMMVGLFLTAEPFILFVYGEKWAAVAPIIRIFCFIGMIDSITTTTGWIFNSQGRTDLQLRWGLYDFIVMTLAFFAGIPWGVTGVAVSYVAAGYIQLYPCWYVAGRLIDLRFSEMVRNLASTFFCAAGMGLAVWFLGLALPPDWPHGARLAVMVPAGALAYAGLIHLFAIRPYLELRELLAERFA